MELKADYELNEKLIKEGAVIYLICELNDMIVEYDENFLIQPHTKKIIEALKRQKEFIISEVSMLLKLVSVPEDTLNYNEYRKFYKVSIKNMFMDFSRRCCHNKANAGYLLTDTEWNRIDNVYKTMDGYLDTESDGDLTCWYGNEDSERFISVSVEPSGLAFEARIEEYLWISWLTVLCARLSLALGREVRDAEY